MVGDTLSKPLRRGGSGNRPFLTLSPLAARSIEAAPFYPKTPLALAPGRL
jgi:hypothetical protein